MNPGLDAAGSRLLIPLGWDVTIRLCPNLVFQPEQKLIER
jgi:hypothetical protein